MEKLIVYYRFLNKILKHNIHRFVFKLIISRFIIYIDIVLKYLSNIYKHVFENNGQLKSLIYILI